MESKLKSLPAGLTFPKVYDLFDYIMSSSQEMESFNMIISRLKDVSAVL